MTQGEPRGVLYWWSTPHPFEPWGFGVCRLCGGELEDRICMCESDVCLADPPCPLLHVDASTSHDGPES